MAPLPTYPKKSKRTEQLTARISLRALSALKTLCEHHNMSQSVALETLFRDIEADPKFKLPQPDKEPKEHTFTVALSSSGKISVATLKRRFDAPSEGDLIERVIMGEYAYYTRTARRR